jgi:hypothetical protein
MIYDKIYDFCKIRNYGSATKNGLTDYPPRLYFIINLIEELGIDYNVIKFKDNRFKNNYFYNIYLKGNSEKMAISHHDIYNPNIDNANDNSASIINCISLKLLNPDINIAIIDGEEPPCLGIGSKKLSLDIIDGYFGKISYVLNLELTGKGGETFFIGKMGSNLENKIINMFNPYIYNVPFNDSFILLNHGIDSTVITTIPLINNKPDYSIMYKIHSDLDNIDSISVDDMKNFTEKIALKILN